jgi:hypothetical protein
VRQSSVRQLASLSIAASVAMATACVMKPGGPDFKRYSRTHVLPVKPAVYQAEELELHVDSGTVTETYFVYGSEGFTAHLRVRLVNRGTQPITVGMNTMGAYRTGIRHATAVYFSDVVLQPGGQANATINIPAGLTKLDRPLALDYKGVRMELIY